MFRGGGGGGGSFGPQVFELIRGLFSEPAEGLLWLFIGLLLIGIILTIIVRMPPSPARPAPRVTSCLVCGGALNGRTYVDRYFPNWIACSDCYERLTPVKQRQYRLRPPAAPGKA
jgi:hypothetical protein